MRGHIFVITGPSGVGKGTICQRLLADLPNLSLSVSATSRPQRAGERDGINYHFKTREQFEALIREDARETDLRKHHLLEWAEYNGNYYGTPRAAVEQALEAGRHVLLEIEVQGALMIQAKFPQACLVFIAPPDMAELERRLQGRGTDTDGDIRNRLVIAERELAQRDEFHHVIINDDLQNAVSQVKNIVQSLSNPQGNPTAEDAPA